MTDLLDESFEVVIGLQYVSNLAEGIQSHGTVRGHNKNISFPLN